MPDFTISDQIGRCARAILSRWAPGAASGRGRPEPGRFHVPLNRTDGFGDSLQLAFVRLPATTPDPGPPIVYLAGGPGGSGIATARGSRFSLFMALRRF